MTDQALSKINKAIRKGRREDINYVDVFADSITDARVIIAEILNNTTEKGDYYIDDIEEVIYVFPITEEVLEKGSKIYRTCIIYLQRSESNNE